MHFFELIIASTSISMCCWFLYATATTTATSGNDGTKFEKHDHVFSSNIFRRRNYVIVASQILRPRVTFGIAVHVFTDDKYSNYYNLYNRSFQFQAVITSNGMEIVSRKERLFWNSPQLVYFPVPVLLNFANYELHVNGVDANGMTIFDELSTLVYESKFVCVVFQTTRQIYSSDQIVRFRILVLQTDLLPFNDAMDVFILDPNNLVVKRWLSVYTNNGVASLKFKLPKLAKNGMWRIRSQIHDQIDEKTFVVETYYQPLFEVIVTSPAYITTSEEEIPATTYGIFPSQKYVRGNATIFWFVRSLLNSSEFNLIHTDSIFIKEQIHDISLPVRYIAASQDDLTGIEVKIEVTVTEFMSGEIVSGYSHSRIISSKIVVKFLSKSPIVFTPGMPLYGQVAIAYDDTERILAETLRNAILKVRLSCDAPFADGSYSSTVVIRETYDDESNSSTVFYDTVKQNAIWNRFLRTGVAPFRFDLPETASNVELTARFETKEANDFVEEKILAVAKYSSNGRHVKVWTSSDDLNVGDYAILHFNTNFDIDVFYILILAKGSVLRFREHRVSSHLVTISEPVSGDMAPLFHVIVYCFSREYEMYSDVVTVPVNGFARFETTLEINTGKDFRNERVEIIASGAEGAFIGVQAVRSTVFNLQSEHEITMTRMMEAFLKFEKNYRSVSKVTWQSRSGESYKESVLYSSQNYIFDTYNAFNLNNLVLLTNVNLSISPRWQECRQQNFQRPCLVDGCFEFHEFCNGIDYCKDGTDESNCPMEKINREEYFLYRVSWNSFIFDVNEGDWAFREIKKNDHVGIEFEIAETPQTSDDWYFSAFNMDMVYGFSIIQSPVVFSSKRPLMAHIAGPRQCHRGEQLGLKIYVHNYDTVRTLVTVTLFASDNYKFVQVEKDGIVASYNARLTSGDHQMLFYLAPNSEEEIRFPVAPAIQRGLVDINFEVSSQSGRCFLSHTVNVLGEGATVNRHTSVSLDLKNRGLIVQYLDIVVDETPIVPYEIWRRYVYGSAAANVTISSDVLGPIIEGRFLSTNSVLKREAKGAMDLLFELYVNIWNVHYLRYTNQLKKDSLKQTLHDCNTLYAEITRYFHEDGWFGHWETSVKDYNPSVWLTAWALRVFKDVHFADWEFYFWIEPRMFVSIISWLLTCQNTDGNFIETSYREHPFDGNLLEMGGEGSAKIALTAHVLISLHVAMEVIDGKLKTDVAISCFKARHALERVIRSISDPYLIALIAYAFSITSSAELGYTFALLRKNMRINEDGLYYWSRLPIKANDVKIENQRPYTQPRLYDEAQSNAVETTSWAVLVYLAHEGVTSIVENAVQWIVSVRMTNNGFVSIIDTAVAYKTLAEFALRSRILDMTNIDACVEMLNSNITQNCFHVANKTAISYDLKVPSVWGHVNVIGKGSGMAFVQMDVDYGVDDDRLKDISPVNTFELYIMEFYSNFRNKSIITIQSCLRYSTSSSRKSGAVILEIQIPTGYNMLESDAIRLIASNVHPTLKDARSIEGKTVWFFDFLDNRLNCFNHTIKRWYPVANMTLYRQALIYEATARERFLQVLINSTALYTLSICEVCGSFQCPYCPYYNTASESVTFNTPFLLLLYIINVAFLK